MKIISVVTPSYNQGEYLEQTILSVLGQAGSFYIDYIIMDGASTDDSVNIIKKFETLLQQNCNTIDIKGISFYVSGRASFSLLKCAGVSYRWVSKKDNGQTDALNRGFQLAVGDIFCWLNSDDIYLGETVFENVFEQFSKNRNVDVITGDGIFISKNGERLGNHRVSEIDMNVLLFLDYHILQPATFLKKHIMAMEHIDETYECAFDAEYFIRLLDKGVCFMKVNCDYAAFRFYDENKTLGMKHTRYREMMAIMKKYSRKRSGAFIKIISAFYRKSEIFLHPYPFLRKGLKHKIFVLIRRFCYRLVKGMGQNSVIKK